MRLASLPLIAGLSLVLVGCGSDDEPMIDAAGDPPPPDAGDPPDAGSPDANNPTTGACGAFEDHITDGMADVAWAFVYETGFVMREDGDDLSDGSINQTWVYTRDAAGRILTSVWTKDGAVQYQDVTTYDANGNRLTWTYDRDGDGMFDSFVTHMYGPDGRRATSEYDTGVDGSINSRATYVYLDADNLWDRIDVDVAPLEGVVSSFQEYTYDLRHGYWTSIHYFQASDPSSPTDRWERSVDANGYPEEEIDYDNTGTPYFRSTWSFSPTGTFLEYGFDLDVNFELDWVYTYLFDCP